MGDVLTGAPATQNRTWSVVRRGRRSGSYHSPVADAAEGVGASNGLRVARGTPAQDGFTFSAVGGVANATPTSGSPSINFSDVVTTGGTDYLIYAQGATGFTIRAHRFRGGTWGDCGAPIIDNNPNEIVSVGVAASDLAVAWSFRFLN